MALTAAAGAAATADRAGPGRTVAVFDLVGVVDPGVVRKHRWADPWMRLPAAADLVLPPAGGKI